METIPSDQPSQICDSIQSHSILEYFQLKPLVATGNRVDPCHTNHPENGTGKKLPWRFSFKVKCNPTANDFELPSETKAGDGIHENEVKPLIEQNITSTQDDVSMVVDDVDVSHQIYCVEDSPVKPIDNARHQKDLCAEITPGSDSIPHSNVDESMNSIEDSFQQEKFCEDMKTKENNLPGSELKSKYDNMLDADSFNGKLSLLVALLRLASEHNSETIITSFIDLLNRRKDAEMQAVKEAEVKNALSLSMWKHRNKTTTTTHGHSQPKNTIASFFKKKPTKELKADKITKTQNANGAQVVDATKPTIETYFKQKEKKASATLQSCDSIKDGSKKRKCHEIEADDCTNKVRRSKRLQSHLTNIPLSPLSADTSQNNSNPFSTANSVKEVKDVVKDGSARSEATSKDVEKECSTTTDEVDLKTVSRASSSEWSNHVNYCSDLWTEKYQPALAKDIIGNQEAIQQLISWLLSWKHQQQKIIRKIACEASQGSKKKGGNKRKEKTTDASDDDSSDDDDDELLCNTMLISGAVGAGSTSSLLACAKELNFKVLELNPSSYRSSKEIVQYFGEAAQSHQVQQGIKSNQNLPSVASFFGKTQVKKHEKKDEGGPTDAHHGFIQNAELSDTISLFLLEQVDCVFDDYDRGFWQAINSLRAESKRPIVLISNDPTVTAHLEGSEFGHVHFSRLTQFTCNQSTLASLQLMCLIERVFVSKDAVDALLKSIDYDIRQAIISLQYICETQQPQLHSLHLNKNLCNELKSLNLLDQHNVLNSSHDVVDNKGQSLLYETLACDNNDSSQSLRLKMEAVSLHKEIRTCVENATEDVIKYSQQNTSPQYQAKVTRDTFTQMAASSAYHSFVKRKALGSSSELDVLTYVLDERSHLDSQFASLYDAIDKHGDSVWFCTPTDSMSLTLAQEDVNNQKVYVEEQLRSMMDDRNNYSQSILTMMQGGETTAVDMSSDIDSYFLDLLDATEIHYTITHREFILDFLPALRTLCCSEDQRKNTETKRSRRFLHYLDGISLFLTDQLKAISAKGLFNSITEMKMNQ